MTSEQPMTPETLATPGLAAAGLADDLATGPAQDDSARGAADPVKRMALRRSLERGMTLVEIMVVIAIIAIIGVALAFGVIPLFASSQKDVAKQQIDTISKGLDTYYLKHREMPDNLEALVEEETLKADQLQDPWKKPFSYEATGRKYHLCSAGEDKQLGSQDDICNDTK